MERLGDNELIYILDKIQNLKDLKSFCQVSKQFLRAACIRLSRLHTSFPCLHEDIIPASPNLLSFKFSKPLCNKHMKLIAQSCPKLTCMRVSLDKNLVPKGDSSDGEFDFNDDGLCEVANACSRLCEVHLSRRLHVGDVGVVYLVRSSKNLTRLKLDGCVNVTDESLKAIGVANHLKYLSLRGCYLVTDLGLKYLAKGDMKNCLERLHLNECDRISDKGIRYLKQMTGLYYLNLSKCGVNITDVGVMAICRLPSLMVLNLSWLINVTDSSLTHISRNCLKMNQIDFTGCEAITGKGLRALVHLRKLKTLKLFSCHNISWEDVKSFAKTSKIHHLGLSRSIKKQIAVRTATGECAEQNSNSYTHVYWDRANDVVILLIFYVVWMES
ncbi:Leucine-rich repeat, cysteine-containing subtype [Artemisia annua]|uniref:Leucine-rich repeat, cysteine-containing subtype n=1 Tax=Artemisia annua TaxID=35608 RepID=A0A2U1P6P9_ARTAN|nr:Leucine-rich repeat, cysteine-containing subtype [Artemisia annua]